MKRKFLSFVIVAGLLLAFSLPVFAQCSSGKLPASFEYLDRLKGEADEAVSVTMDRQLINLALKFLSKDDPDSAKIREAIQGVNAICVRSLEFKRDGAYQMSEVDKMRKELISGAGWMKIVEVRGKEQNVDVALHTDGDKIMGLVVIAAEARELTVVNLIGTIKPEQLTDLEGRFAGIPHIGGLEEKGHKRPRSESETDKGSAPKAPQKDE